MKAPRQTLDSLLVEEDFFDDSLLFALGCHLPGYTLCWWLNRLFDVNFFLDTDCNVSAKLADKKQPKSAGSLFGQLETEEREWIVHFPVYRHERQYSEASLLLYTNHIGATTLIPELKKADYLLLVQNAGSVAAPEDFYLHLSKIDAVDWHSRQDMSLIKSLGDLMF
ncbi:MAG: IPExxxVDY family protein [Edaphocola sp.]